MFRDARIKTRYRVDNYVRGDKLTPPREPNNGEWWGMIEFDLFESAVSYARNLSKDNESSVRVMSVSIIEEIIWRLDK